MLPSLVPQVSDDSSCLSPLLAAPFQIKTVEGELDELRKQVAEKEQALAMLKKKAGITTFSVV